MKIINAHAEIISSFNGEEMLRNIELCGRTCYKSEDMITDSSARAFVKNIIKRGHEAVLEHESVTVKFVVDRGVSHEIVRHRLAAYCQESTRYCNYAKGRFDSEITFIRPCFWVEDSLPELSWRKAMQDAENSYLNLVNNLGCSPQEARAVLPNSLKTEVVMTANLREWRHFFKLRTAPAAHPQMREVTIPLLHRMQELIPVVFDDIKVEQ